jgi:two-component sensor histidine kinase
MDQEENAFLNMDEAVPFGIIVNELVSNSIKHAFIGKDNGRIYINLRREKNGCKSASFILAISDDGIGIPKSIDLENPNSLGIQLVTTLVDQLAGELELTRSKGTEFTIRFTAAEKEKSID